MWRYAKSKFYGAAVILSLISSISPAIAGATAEIRSNICGDFTAPTITSPASGLITQDSNAIITGQGEPSLPITIIDNGVSVAVTTISSGGEYSVSVPLSGGVNVITAKEVNACETAKESESINIQRSIVSQPSAGSESTPQDSTPTVSIAPITPALSPSASLDQPIPSNDSASNFNAPVVNTPSSGATYTAGSVWVSGTAEPSSLVTIYVNGLSVAKLRASSVGIFGAMVELNIGSNSIRILAEKDGKSAISQPIIVIYAPSKAPEKSTSLLTVTALVVGGTVAVVLVMSGGAWIIGAIGARRLR